MGNVETEKIVNAAITLRLGEQTAHARLACRCCCALATQPTSRS